ncbi:Uncharacterised protein [Bordetella pertussis]|nr:Uncharacterised protein [Bordetella pertussis]CFM17736.1 Uncharacterised protein [Bordetella pertussis]CFO36118.1 Uncharacterised protein [Bordetella pertussis]CFP09067.1 Uncharacterised protein [Bordetella pertussis]CFU07514.1 Uncharacterised protein [Bordetella pertussis]
MYTEKTRPRWWFSVCSLSQLSITMNSVTITMPDIRRSSSHSGRWSTSACARIMLVATAAQATKARIWPTRMISLCPSRAPHTSPR